jgi:hypothetical protein
MKRGSVIACAALGAFLPFLISGCDDDHHDDHHDDQTTIVIGTVQLGGVGVDGASVRAIFDGFVVATGVSAPDGTFMLFDFDEFWEPFFVQALYVDPVTLDEYFGETVLFFTADEGSTDVGPINLELVVPLTQSGPHADVGNLDGDPIDDLAAVFPDALVVQMGSGAGGLVETELPEGQTFGTVSIEDVDGDGIADLSVTLVPSGGVAVYHGDGAGGFKL